MKRILSNILLAVGTMLLCLLLGEAGIRYLNHHTPHYDFEMWRYASELKQPLPSAALPFHHFPNKAGQYYGVEIKTNSLGLRDDERRIPKPAGTKRIIFLGDSFTLGWGVPFGGIITKQLEQMLHKAGNGYEVINMGVGNYNSSMEVELFKLKGLQLEPDMVVLMYFTNDTEPTPAVSSCNYKIIKHSYFVGYLDEKVRQVRTMKGGNAGLMDYYRSIYAPGSPGMAENRDALNDLIRICRDRGIRLLIVNIPDLRKLRPYPFSFATDYIRNIAGDAQAPFLDLLPVFEKHEEQSLWVSPEDPHMNAKANALAAAAIYEMIIREKLINSGHEGRDRVHGALAGLR